MNVWSRKSICLLALAGAGCSAGFRILFTLIGMDGYQTAEQQLIADKSLLYLLIELVLLSPALEEWIFRHILYHRLKKWIPVSLAMVISSLLFGIYHWNLPQGIYAFVMGMLLAWALERFQTIKAPLVIHMAANAAALFMSVLNL